MAREHNLLGPLERLGVMIVGGDKSVDLVANLARRGKTGAGQGLVGEDRKPDLNLVEPGRMGRDEVKMDVLVTGEPAVVFRLVGVQIVENDVQLAVRVLGDEAVHKVQKFDPPTAPVMAAFDQAGGHVEGGKQGGGAVALVVVAEPGQRALPGCQ